MQFKLNAVDRGRKARLRQIQGSQSMPTTRSAPPFHLQSVEIRHCINIEDSLTVQIGW